MSQPLSLYDLEQRILLGTLSLDAALSQLALGERRLFLTHLRRKTRDVLLACTGSEEKRRYRQLLTEIDNKLAEYAREVKHG